MRRNSQPGGLRWIVTHGGLFLMSLFLGSLVPDGLNWIVEKLGMVRFDVTPLTRFFSALVVWLTVAVAELALFVRGSATSLASIVEEAVALATPLSLERSLVRALLPQLQGFDDDGRQAGELIQEFSRTLSTVPPSLMEAYSVLLERGLVEIKSIVDALERGGLDVDINEHIEISRRCAQKARSFVTINRSAFTVPEEWTKDWCQFVDELGARSIAKEYIVLMSQKDLAGSVLQIEGMRKYLSERHWHFRTCNVEHVRDSLGGALPTDANVDVFDGRIAKLQQPPSGRYLGGVRLTLTIVDLARSPELRRFVDRVQAVCC